MGLMDIFKGAGAEIKGAANIDEYVELEVEEGTSAQVPTGKLVKVCKLKGFADVDMGARELTAGNVVILDIKPLAERSMNELRHAIDEIKDLTVSMGGDIAGLSEYHLILTPPGMRIERTMETKRKEFEATLDRIRQKKLAQ
ncbi:MAG: cell division protein SepF [Euryarchaeota archaeon]|nr:cell division protein SepF [Euryarchaeota archaeon]